ncbi:MAG TPA: hypothetical protein VIM41_01940 [Gammaproteobacteria bacterium]
MVIKPLYSTEHRNYKLLFSLNIYVLLPFKAGFCYQQPAMRPQSARHAKKFTPERLFFRASGTAGRTGTRRLIQPLSLSMRKYLFVDNRVFDVFDNTRNRGRNTDFANSNYRIVMIYEYKKQAGKRNWKTMVQVGIIVIISRYFSRTLVLMGLQ